MKLDRLQTYFSTSPAAKLLRSPHAAQIVYFLHRHFKESNRITTPHSAFVQDLNEFLIEVHTTDPEVLKDRPETYATAWSTGDSRWVRRFLDAGHAEAVYELTPHTESVLRFLDDALERNLGFVGTESRLKRIIDTLTDLVVRGSADPTRRLEHLRGERERIDREIASIESGKHVSTYSPTAIRERFSDAVMDLGSLQGDFRAVEDCFKDITRNVQKRQAELSGSRGEILGAALDAEDCLKSQDQGISFDEFVRLVLSPSKQNDLERIVGQLDQIEALVEQVDGMRRLKGMMGSLADEAEKVLGTTRRLSATLRRLLDSRVTATRLRLAAVLREIRGSAVRLAQNPPGNDVGIEVLTELNLSSASERTFWTAPTSFDAGEFTLHKPDEDDLLDAFRRLAALQRLDWGGMRSKIGNLLHERERISLPELLVEHPPENGAVEILGYVQIAHDDGHAIDASTTDVISVRRSIGSDAVEQFEVPSVTFLPKHVRSMGNALSNGDQTL